MEVEIFALCDAAADYAGRLTVLGVFDVFSYAKFPAVYPHCAVAVRVRFERIEEGNHRVRLNIVNEDGKFVIPALEGNLAIRLGEGLQSCCSNMVLGINGLKLEKPGRYSIDIAIDGRQERSLPIHVLQIGEKPPQQD